MVLLYAPAVAGLSSDCDLLSDASIAAWLTWNGKPMQPASLQRAWKKGGWIRRLSGLTLSPSRRDSLLAEWTSSLPAFPASRGALPESGAGQRTSAGSGRTSGAWFVRRDPSGSSWKTSAASFVEELNTYSGTWPTAGSMRSGHCYRRRRSAPATSASASSSWPTVTAERSSSHTNPYLDPIAQRWPTPDTQNDRDGATMRAEAKGSHAVSLHHAVELWQTPQTDSFRSRGGARKDEQGLDQQARFWPTPTEDGNYNRKGASPTSGDGLETAAAAWGTPTSRDADKWHYREPGHPRQVNLSGQASAYSLPVQTSESAGQPSSENAPTSRRRLNPLFVEWLQGWPENWSTPCPAHAVAPAHFASWEMASCLSRPVRHTSPSERGSRSST